ncbi:hypothetical protein ACS0TY_023879 [Phlomoides rotata]
MGTGTPNSFASTGLSSLIVNEELSFDSEIISDSVVQFYIELFMGTFGDCNRFFRPMGVSLVNFNPSKSKVYFGSAITRWVKNTMLSTMGITVGSLPFSYLGVPIFRGSPRTCHLAALTDTIISKFTKWKGHSLSLADLKCIVNFVIAASLVHSMMVYYWPRSLLKKIETAMRNFLCNGDISRKNTSCSVSWARCFSPLEEGGWESALSALLMNLLFVSLLGTSSATSPQIFL